jgi:hypothetical protein
MPDADIKTILTPQERQLIALIEAEPLSRRELTKRLLRLEDPRRLDLVNVGAKINKLRAKLEPYGFTIPRNEGGHPGNVARYRLVKLSADADNV